MPTEEQPTAAPTGPSKSPNKTLLIVIGVVILLALAGGAYMLLGKDSGSNSNSNSQNENSSNNSNSNSTGDKKSISSLLSAGENISCSVKYTDDGNNAEGQVYISGSKFYGEFSGTIDGEAYNSYVMSDGDYSYVWSTGSNQGVKAKLDEDDKTEIVESVDLEKEGDTDCSNWSVDNSKFTAPSNIEFLDFSVPAQ